MKTKIISILLLFYAFTSITFVFAKPTDNPDTEIQATTSNQANTNTTNTNSSQSNKYVITEKHPFAKNCVPAKKSTWATLGYEPIKLLEFKAIPVYERAYICEDGEWLQWLYGSIKGGVNWIVQISLLLWVLGIAGLGITWVISGWDDIEQKRKLKEWLIGLVIGLLILFFFQYILKWIAPWIFK